MRKSHYLPLHWWHPLHETNAWINFQQLTRSAASLFINCSFPSCYLPLDFIFWTRLTCRTSFPLNQKSIAFFWHHTSVILIHAPVSNWKCKMFIYCHYSFPWNTACWFYEDLLWYCKHFVTKHSPYDAYSDTHCILLSLEYMAFYLRYPFIILRFSITPSVILCLTKDTHYIYGEKKPRHYGWMDPSCQSLNHSV